MVCILACIVSGASTGESVAMPQCHNHSDLTTAPEPVTLTSEPVGGATLASSCTTPVKTAADWERRRADIMVGAQAAMGDLPSRATLPDLNIITESSITLKDGIVRSKITFSSTTVDSSPRIPGLLYVPPSATANNPAPAILASHPTSTAGKAYSTIRAPPLDYAEELSRRGAWRIHEMMAMLTVQTTLLSLKHPNLNTFPSLCHCR